MRRKYCKVDRERGVKVCPSCDVEKPLDEFHHRKDGSIYPYCKPCNVARAAAWADQNRERKTAGERTRREKRQADDPEAYRHQARQKHYRQRYGFCYDEVLKVAEQQSFRCAICTEEVTLETLYVDHCHGSGKLRGILCNRCNIGLASLERPGYLDAALAYLERHRSGS